MKIFLSWSGEGSQSHRLAQAFKEWLPTVFQSAKPFLSSKDLYAGVQWFPKLKEELEAADFGIVCLTRSNRTAPYIMIESGAIAMRIGDTKLVPVLCDMSLTDLGESPLKAFNCVHLTRDGVWKLADSINITLGDRGLPSEMLSKTFNIWWPEFEQTITDIIATPDKSAPAKKDFNVESAVEQIHNNMNALVKSQLAGRLQYLELTKALLTALGAIGAPTKGLIRDGLAHWANNNPPPAYVPPLDDHSKKDLTEE
jgi:hypothetical protein